MSLVRVKGRDRVIEKVVLTPKQMLTVRENLVDPYLLMAELACCLGLRICEVLGLMWDDFDSEAKTLSIRRSAVDGIVADVKSEASRLVIPLNDDFISFLTRWQKIAPASEESWMFPSVVTGRPYQRRHSSSPPSPPAGCKGRSSAPGMAYLPSHVPQLDRCCGNGGGRSTEDDAALGRDHNDECLWKGNDGQQARSPHQTMLARGLVGLRVNRHQSQLVDSDGRGGGIRTPDPLLPKQMRYQTALRPDT